MATLWTIGYEKLLPPELVAELEHAGVERVIDVRFRPQSRRPGMSKTRLGEMLGDRGIAYEPRRTLGTPPDIRHLFRRTGSPRRASSSAPTSRRAPPTSSTRSQPSCRTRRARRCCAWRPTRRAATGAWSRSRWPSACRASRSSTSSVADGDGGVGMVGEDAVDAELHEAPQLGLGVGVLGPEHPGVDEQPGAVRVVATKARRDLALRRTDGLREPATSS